MTQTKMEGQHISYQQHCYSRRQCTDKRGIFEQDKNKDNFHHLGTQKLSCPFIIAERLNNDILQHEEPEKAMAPHSSTLAWKIPWTEEPGRLQSMGLHRVGHDRATSLSLFLSYIGEGNGNPLQCSCLENPRNGGSWQAAVCGVAQSRTRLKRLSSRSIGEIQLFQVQMPGRTTQFTAVRAL